MAISELIDDAIKSLGSRASGAGVSAEKLWEVWAAVDRYTSACLEQKRGLCLPNFCRIGWQAVRIRGKVTFRPYFQLVDAFCRAYGIDPAKCGPVPAEICVFEDFNFSKAAIRFSTELTKDQVSSGLRVLVRQLGETVSQGRPLAAEFSFGKISCREGRDLQFDFAAELYVEHGLEVPPGAVEDIEYKPSATFGHAPTEDALRSLNLKGVCVKDGEPNKSRNDSAAGKRPLHGQSRATSEGRRCTSMSSATPSESGVSSILGRGSWEYTSAGSADILQPRRGRSDAESTRESAALPTPRPAGKMRKPPLAFGAQRGAGHAVDRTRDEALQREITELEVRAGEALRDQSAAVAFSDQTALEEARARQQKRAQMREHSDVLKQQMQAKLQRLRAQASAGAAADDIASALVFGAADSQEAMTMPAMGRSAPQATPSVSSSSAAGIGSGNSDDRYREGRSAVKPPPLVAAVEGRVGHDSACREASKEFRQALDEQVQLKQMRRDAIRRFEQRLDNDVLEYSAAEAANQKAGELAARAHEREVLAEAWQEGEKIKDIKRAIECVEIGKRTRGSKGGKDDSGKAFPPWPSASRRGVPSVSEMRLNDDVGCASGIGVGGACYVASSTPRGSSGKGSSGGGSTTTPRGQPLSARGAPLGAAACLALRPTGGVAASTGPVVQVLAA
eukprot:TRINITY_DN62454_c0_g1_i1.p1 TRINITY_DN62454_c0_g1~~TRINITY_DN62454_c0_g1_i1.p1  ORF type:complete len:677 (-),score=120.78 TRINITY_DN62454_c0_g1_i1:125-2155(-)